MTGKCFYCGAPMKKRGSRNVAGLDRTEDHVTPKSHGGHRSQPGNIVHCHRRCNEDKANRTLEQYRVIVAQRKGIAPETFKFPGEINW